MTEHTFSYGPNKLPPADVVKIVESVAKAYGLTYVTYPTRTEFDPRWAFHGQERGRFEEADLEDKVRNELDAAPAFKAWCQSESN